MSSLWSELWILNRLLTMFLPFMEHCSKSLSEGLQSSCKGRKETLFLGIQHDSSHMFGSMHALT